MDEPGTWLTINEAAKLTGWLPDKIRSDRRRGRLQSRKNNAGEWLILIPAEAMTVSTEPPGLADGQAAGHSAAEPPAWLIEELTELSERCGHAEGRANAMAERIAGMAESLAKAEARGDR